MSNIQSTQLETKSKRQSPSLRQMLNLDGTVLRLLGIVIVLFVVFSIARPDAFPTARNLQSMAFQAAEIGILAMAVAITMLTGGIDLSVLGMANLTAILAGLILTSVGGDATGGQVTLAILLAVGAAFIIGPLLGLVNGFLVAYVGISPILTTLGTLTLYQGIGTVITQGRAVYSIDAFNWIGNGDVIGIPVPLLIFLLLALLVGIILSRSRFGFEVYMLGANPTAARFSGINSRQVLLRTYMMSGFLAAIAGLIILGRTNAIRIDFGESYILLSIMICVLGGINPMGGFGRMIGVVLAVIAIQFLSTGMNMVLFQSSGANFFKEAAWGALLLLVLMGDYLASRRRRRRTTEK